MTVMITLNSEYYRALAKHLFSIGKGDYLKGRQTVNLPDVRNCDDYFLTLLHLPEMDKFFSRSRFRHFDEWLAMAEKYRGELHRSQTHLTAADSILYQIWEAFRRGLLGKLERFLKEGEGLPGEGGIISFIGGLARCLILRYGHEGDSLRLQVKGVIPEPNDFWADSSDISTALRDEIKSIYNSGHRLTFHKGVLVHVGKQAHPGVFGPSIDTLVMSEVLTQLPQFQEQEYTKAIEIGSGSGLLTAVILAMFPGLKDLSAIDINNFATKCTRKNVSLNSFLTSHMNQPSCRFINEAFRVKTLYRPFDLIVCSPPYIPVPLMREGFDGSRPDTISYYESIADISLMQLLIEEAPDLLTASGQLLLLTSSCAITQTLNSIPRTCRVSQPLGVNGFQALFDIDAVINNPQWLSYLLESKGLQRIGDTYYHRLHPMLIELKDRC